LIALGAVANSLAYLTKLEIIFQAPGAGDVEIDASTRKNIFLDATQLARIANALKLKASEGAAHSLLAGLEKFSKQSQLVPLMHDATMTIVRELHSVKFLPATPEMEKYLDLPFPFGKHVANSFPECSEDISQAHQCFAYEQYTAAMFHLGRAMEIVVKRLAKRMRATKPARHEWQHYINAMNEKIKQMPFKTPQQKERRAIFSEATNYLFNFKEGWRNPTMHPKRTYKRSEALTVLEGTGAFLKHVAKKLFKSPNDVADDS
jgi:hypothetical protein